MSHKVRRDGLTGRSIDSLRYDVRPATLEDLNAILGIEQRSFSSPWPEFVLAEEIAKRSWSRVRAACTDETVVGFMVYWTVVSELHLLNLAVHPRWRRSGIGTLLMTDLVETAQRESFEEIILEVRASNEHARALYHRFGFKALDVRRGYYTDTGEDAVVMALELALSRETGRSE